MAAGIVVVRLGGDRQDPAHQVIPEQDAQELRPVGPGGYALHPGRDASQRQQRAEPEFPAQQLAPAAFPGDEAQVGQHRHQPGREILAEEGQREPRVHRQIAAQPALARRGREPAVHTGQREADAGEQQRVGVEPDLHLIDQGAGGEHGAGGERQRRRVFPAGQQRARQGHHRKKSQQGIGELRQPRGGRTVAEARHRRTRQPVG